MSMDNSYETRILEEKTDKLGLKLIIVSVIIPVILLAVGFFAYSDIKNNIMEISKETENQSNKISQEVQNKIFDLSSKAEALESKLSDYEEKMKQSELIIQKIKKEYGQKLKGIKSDVKKNIQQDVSKIGDNKKRINTLARELKTNKSKIKKLQNLSSESKKESRKLLEEIKGINAEIGLINENQNQFLGFQKSVDLKIKEADKKLKTELKKIDVSKLNKSIDSLYREIKKNEIETRILKDKLSALEKQKKGINSSPPPLTEHDIVEE